MNALEHLDTASVIEATRRRYANASTQLVNVESPRVVVVDAKKTARLHRQRFVARVTLIPLMGATGSAVAVGPQVLPGPFIALATAVLFAATVLLSWLEYHAGLKIRGLTQKPILEVPNNVRDAWRRVQAITDGREDAPEWMVTAAFRAVDVLVEISEHHLAGTGESAVCRELADALFVTAARIDAWDLLNPEVADDAETVLPASASLMFEESTPGPHPTARG